MSTYNKRRDASARRRARDYKCVRGVFAVIVAQQRDERWYVIVKLRTVMRIHPDLTDEAVHYTRYWTVGMKEEDRTFRTRAQAKRFALRLVGDFLKPHTARALARRLHGQWGEWL